MARRRRRPGPVRGRRRRSRATGTSSAGSKRAPCCSARSRAPQHTLVGRPLRGVRAAPHRAARAVPARARRRRRHGTRYDAYGSLTGVRRRRPRPPSPAGVRLRARHRPQPAASCSRRPWTASPDASRAQAPWPTTTSCGCRSPPAACSTAPRTAPRPQATCWSTARCGSGMVNQQYRLLSAAGPLDRAAGARPRGPYGRGHQGRRGRPRPGGPGAARLHRQATGGRAPRARTRGRRRHVRRLPHGRRGGRDHARRRPRRAARVSDRIDPVERIALASRIRTRAVRLDGPLVAREHRPAGGPPGASPAPRSRCCGGAAGTRRWTRQRQRGRRLGKANAAELEPRAVMFYRPLPEQPLTAWRLLRFSLRGTRMDLRNLAARRAGGGRRSARWCRSPPDRCSASTCPTPRRASSRRSRWRS